MAHKNLNYETMGTVLMACREPSLLRFRLPEIRLCPCGEPFFMEVNRPFFVVITDQTGALESIL